jgi:LTXXQ motif family protein
MRHFSVLLISAPSALNLNKNDQHLALPRAATLKMATPAKARLMRGISATAIFLLTILPITAAAQARPGGGGGRAGAFGGHIGVGGTGFGGRGGGLGFAGRSFGGARSGHIGVGGTGFAGRGGGLGFAGRSVGGARSGGLGMGDRSLRAGHFTGRSFTTPQAGVSRGVFGNRAIANVALQSRWGYAGFHGRFFGSPWPWWWGGLAIGWIGPVFWPYVYYDFFDYVFWPYAYDDFWPYAYDDIYYGIYGPYAYGGPVVEIAAAPGVSIPARTASTAERRVARTGGSEQRAAEVCNNNTSDLTDWPIERISQVVQPTEAQRAALDELRAASEKAISILKAGCPNDLPSTPTGRLAAMESRVQIMLQAVQTVRPPLEHFYQQLSNEQKARFDALSPGGESTAGADQRNLTKLCQERAPGVTDLPFDRIAQATQPTPPQRPALDELKDASIKAAQGLKANCPMYEALTPTGRIGAIEKRLEATHGAVTTVQPALTKFYDGLSDEQKARFNSLRSAAVETRPPLAGGLHSRAEVHGKTTDAPVRVAPSQQIDEE